MELPLEKYKCFIEDVLRGLPQIERRGYTLIRIRRLTRMATRIVADKSSSKVVAKIVKSGKTFSIRYTYDGFNKIYLFDEKISLSPRLRAVLFRVRRISSRNLLTHKILTGIIEHQRKYLSTGKPIDLVPFSQVQLTRLLNTYDLQLGTVKKPNFRHPERSEGSCISSRFFGLRPQNDNLLGVFQRSQLTTNISWTSRLVSRLSIITPSGEEKLLKWFFPTQKDINKRLIKQLIDKENDDLQSGTLKKPYTDNELRMMLETSLREKYEQCNTQYASRTTIFLLSRHSIGHCRRDMGIPSAKRRLSGYKYPPLSANFSLAYPLTTESIIKYAPAESGVYEFSINKNKRNTKYDVQYTMYDIRHTKYDIRNTVFYIGSTKNIRKRLREHLGRNSKNGNIRDFLKRFSCNFRYIMIKKNWQEEEKKLYGLFMDTYGSSLKCDKVRP